MNEYNVCDASRRDVYVEIIRKMKKGNTLKCARRTGTWFVNFVLFDLILVIRIYGPSPCAVLKASRASLLKKRDIIRFVIARVSKVARRHRYDREKRAFGTSLELRHTKTLRSSDIIAYRSILRTFIFFRKISARSVSSDSKTMRRYFALKKKVIFHIFFIIRKRGWTSTRGDCCLDLNFSKRFNNISRLLCFVLYIEPQSVRLGYRTRVQNDTRKIHDDKKWKWNFDKKLYLIVLRTKAINKRINYISRPCIGDSKIITTFSWYVFTILSTSFGKIQL